MKFMLKEKNNLQKDIFLRKKLSFLLNNIANSILCNFVLHQTDIFISIPFAVNVHFRMVEVFSRIRRVFMYRVHHWKLKSIRILRDLRNKYLFSCFN